MSFCVGIVAASAAEPAETKVLHIAFCLVAVLENSMNSEDRGIET